MTIFVECKNFRDTVRKNVEAYRRGKQRITSSSDILGGEPVFRGTRIPLAHVAALFRKEVPEGEIAEDFSALDDKDLQYAAFGFSSRPPPGRPRNRTGI